MLSISTKGSDSGVFASDYGYSKGWDQAYLVDIDGQMQLLVIRVESSTYPSLGAGSAISNVLEDTDYGNASLKSTKVLDNGNKALYSSTTLLKTTDLSK